MKRGEFGRLTLRGWYELRKRHTERQTRVDSLMELMLAQLTAMVANTGFVQFEESRRVEEFMPSQRKGEKRRPKQTFDEKMRSAMERAVKYQDEQVKRGIR